jgi:hypothetical protein
LRQAKVLLRHSRRGLIASGREVGLILIPDPLIAEIKLTIKILLEVKATQIAGMLSHTTIKGWHTGLATK